MTAARVFLCPPCAAGRCARRPGRLEQRCAGPDADGSPCVCTHGDARPLAHAAGARALAVITAGLTPTGTTAAVDLVMDDPDARTLAVALGSICSGLLEKVDEVVPDFSRTYLEALGLAYAQGGAPR